MKSYSLLFLSIAILHLISGTPLTDRSIRAFNEVYPRCFNSSATSKGILRVEEMPSLFSKKFKVTL